MYKEITGDLIVMTKQGMFDAVAHGCNCFCTMGAGLARQMKDNFFANALPLEANQYRGDKSKLGLIDYREWHHSQLDPPYADVCFTIINCYTQYHYSYNKRNSDYGAIRKCMKAINFYFKGKHIGMPQIGCGLGGGDWNIVKQIIQESLTDCAVTIVIYKP